MTENATSLVPTAEQAAIRDCDAKDILVAAGAGTGKTTTTRLRFVRLLEEEIAGGVLAAEALGRILVFTFTDKAAGELEEGIRRDTASLLNPESPEAATMSSAWVGTFHSICSRILRSFPLEAGVDPGFEVIDKVDATALKARAFNQALSQLLDRHEDEDERTRAGDLAATLGIDRLRKEIRDAYDELRARGIAEPRLPADDLPTPYPATLVGQIKDLATRMVEDETRPNSSPRKKAQALVDHLDRDGGELTVELARESRGNGKAKDSDFNKLTGLLNDALGKLVAIADGDVTYRTVSRLLELYGASYEALKGEGSLLDFEDLQIKTRDLLRNNEAVGDYYRERFREIMVDEFQDTNGLQLDLIDSLRGPETTLMTVGDEMQSIYRFRHANVQIFRDRGKKVPKDGLLKMKGNNRSDQTILAAVNRLGRALDRQARKSRPKDENRHEFADLEQGDMSERGPGYPGSVRLMLIDRGNWAPLDLGPISPPRKVEDSAERSSGESRAEAEDEGASGEEKVGFEAAEALAVAQAARDLVDKGIDQKDIVILLRAMTRAHWYEDALRQVRLTPYTISGRGFWRSSTVQKMVTLLRVVANPLDEDSVMTAMLSPACGVSADVPLILRRGGSQTSGLWDAAVTAVSGDPGGDGWFEELDPEDRELLGNFCRAIEDVRSRTASLPLDELIEEVTVRTGYDLAAVARDPAAMQDLRRLASLASDYEETHSRDLRGFLDWTEASQEEDDEAQVATEDERSEVVRIMTVHAAKGAQFEAVFVPDLGRRFQTDKASLLILGPSPDPAVPGKFSVGIKIGEDKAYDWREIHEGSKAANEDEELRLLHVAMTRACGHLILSGSPQEPKSLSELSAIIDRLNRGFALMPGAGHSDDGGGEEVEELPAEVELTALMPTPETAQHLARHRDPLVSKNLSAEIPFPPLIRPPTQTYPDIPLSFTALGEFQACPVKFFTKRVLRLDEEGAWPFGGPEGESTGRRGDGAAFGTAIHSLMERAAATNWSQPPRDRVAAELEAEGIRDENSVDLAERMVSGLLTSDFMKTIRGKKVEAEVPLILDVEGVVIRGFIDLLVPGEQPLVVDFKTNQLDGKSPEEHMEGEYGLQRDLYALAVAKAAGSEGEPAFVRTAFVFLGDPEAPVPVLRDYGPSELAEAEAGIQSLVQRILDAEGTPGHQGCRECWACQRLGIEKEG